MNPVDCDFEADCDCCENIEFVIRMSLSDFIDEMTGDKKNICITINVSPSTVKKVDFVDNDETIYDETSSDSIENLIVAAVEQLDLEDIQEFNDVVDTVNDLEEGEDVEDVTEVVDDETHESDIDCTNDDSTIRDDDSCIDEILEDEVDEADEEDEVQTEADLGEAEGVELEEGTTPSGEDIETEVELGEVEGIELEEEEDIECDLGDVEAEEEVKVEKKKLTRKLNWVPKPSTPKYILSATNKLNVEKVGNASITTKGKASQLAQKRIEESLSKAKTVKDVFKTEKQEKKEADIAKRNKIVTEEKARVEAAKKIRIENMKKLKEEAANRIRQEAAEKKQAREEFERKRDELSKARVQAIRSNKKE